MARMIQIRHVPEELHRTLKVRAAANSLSLSDYLLQELREIAEKPTLVELFEQVALGRPVDLDAESIVRGIHEDREEHDRKLERLTSRRK
jgi:plasmid stability protein